MGRQKLNRPIVLNNGKSKSGLDCSILGLGLYVSSIISLPTSIRSPIRFSDGALSTRPCIEEPPESAQNCERNLRPCLAVVFLEDLVVFAVVNDGDDFDRIGCAFGLSV